MKKIKLGMLGTSNIAFRRFLPALKLNEEFEYTGLAIADASEWASPVDAETYKSMLEVEKKKGEDFCREYGGDVSFGYEEFLSSDKFDAVYIPLPPGLHYKWAKKALEYGKHVLLEKPFTTTLEHTQELITLATKKELALHENYAFCYHKQFAQIMEMLNNGEIGDIRQIRTTFGFPFRGATDFRYIKSLGGGALLDCGGYPIKMAARALGKSAKVTAASLQTTEGFDVDIFGSATLQNDNGLTAQVSFGMDNSYKCEAEFWGSKGHMIAPRIYTAPKDLSPTIAVNDPDSRTINIPCDDQFANSIGYFASCVKNADTRQQSYDEIMQQSVLIDSVFSLGQRS